MADDPDHCFGLIQTVKAFKFFNRLFRFCFYIAQRYALFRFTQQQFLVPDNTIVENLGDYCYDQILNFNGELIFGQDLICALADRDANDLLEFVFFLINKVRQ